MASPGTRRTDDHTHQKEMVTVHFNLHDRSDMGSMLGPSVALTGSDESVSVEVGSRFGATALKPAEWEALATQRGDKPYVLVDYIPGRKPIVSPLRTYADAMAEFNRETYKPATRWDNRHDYFPDSGRHLAVMSQADYLEASKNWSPS